MLNMSMLLTHVSIFNYLKIHHIVLKYSERMMLELDADVFLLGLRLMINSSYHFSFQTLVISVS